MAVGFPSPIGVYVPKPGEPKYQVTKRRYGDKMEVWVWCTAHTWPSGLYSKYIDLKWHWWQRSSPAERIRRAWDKAQKQADKLNAQELYLQHEADLVEALDK